MKSRFIDWIWHIRGSVALAPEQSSDEVFDKLVPLFRQGGTSYERTTDALIFRKKDQAAQDKMSIFDFGVLQIERGMAGSVLRYHLTSRALLFCFLAPVLFLGIAQLTLALGKLETPAADAASKSAKDSGTSKKPATKDADVPLNWIDKALGAPTPEKTDKEAAGGEDEDKKFSPTTAYVFAGIFATLFVVGRILEDKLVKELFKRKILNS